MEEIKDSAGRQMYNNCLNDNNSLNDSNYFNKLNIHELKAVQKVCYKIIGEGWKYAFQYYDKKKLPEISGENIPENANRFEKALISKRNFSGMVNQIDKALNSMFIDPDFINYLPESYYEAEKILKQIKDKFKTKGGRKTPENSFESLFIDPDNAKRIIEILKDNEDLNAAGQWVSEGDKKKIGTALWVLIDKTGIIKPGNDMPRFALWCKGLGSIKDQNELRNILKRPENDPHLKPNYKEYQELFKQIK